MSGNKEIGLPFETEIGISWWTRILFRHLPINRNRKVGDDWMVRFSGPGYSGQCPLYVLMYGNKELGYGMCIQF